MLTRLAFQQGQYLLQALAVGRERVLAHQRVLRVCVELQMHPIDGELLPRRNRRVNEARALGGAGCRRLSLRRLRGALGQDALDRTAANQGVEDATVRIDVVVRQIQLADAGATIVGGLACRAGAGDVRIQQLLLDGPVDFGVDAAVVAGLDGVQGALPQVEGIVHVAVVRAVLLHVLACRIQVVALHAQGRVVLPVGGLEGRGAGQIVADGAQGRRDGHNIQARNREAVLEHAQHQVGAGNLQQHGRLGHVRVAVDDVHATELRGVGVRLVTGVNERASAGG